MTDDVPSEQRVWDLVLKILVPVSIAYFGWCTVTVFQIEKRVAVIEASRYTPADALTFERSTNERFLALTALIQQNSSDLATIREILTRIEEQLREK